MYEKYGKEVEFFVVYIREAHPTDGWQVGANVREEILITQPKSLLERSGVARQMCEALKISIPTYLDGMDDKVNQAYSGWPDRLYLVGVDGKIAYKGGPGPGGFRPDELEQAIQRHLQATEASNPAAPR